MEARELAEQEAAKKAAAAVAKAEKKAESELRERDIQTRARLQVYSIDGCNTELLVHRVRIRPTGWNANGTAPAGQ